jgi:CubicO group peptidase (beta-lactamase class C family)
MKNKLCVTSHPQDICFLLLLSLLIFIISSAYAQEPTSLYFPQGTEWETVTFSEIGWDETGTGALLFYLELTGSHIFVVLKDGKILMENYWSDYTKDSPYPLFSATKGMTAVLIGNAQDRGDLSINDRVSDILGTGWTNTTPEQEQAITVRHLLSMASGLDDDLFFEAPAGGIWRYGHAYGKLYDVLLAATGKTKIQLIEEEIIQPLEMEHMTHVADQTWVDCSGRDAARYGLMMLAKGDWDGTSILADKDYFEDMLKPSASPNPSYGYLWWLNGKSSYMLPGSQTVYSGPMMPDAPSDSYMAAGAFSQFVITIPSFNVVIVRMGTLNLVSPEAYANEIIKLTLAMAPNTEPSISSIPDQLMMMNTSAGPISFAVDDLETTSYPLILTAESSDPLLIDTGGIVFGGSGEQRTVTLIPALDMHGTADITLTVTDPRGLTASTGFVLTVREVNHVPSASDASLETEKNTAIDITLTAEDADGDALTYVIQDYPIHGTLSSDNGDNLLTYTPDTDFAGVDTFTFIATDSIDNSSIATVTITVKDIRDDFKKSGNSSSGIGCMHTENNSSGAVLLAVLSAIYALMIRRRLSATF